MYQNFALFGIKNTYKAYCFILFSALLANSGDSEIQYPCFICRDLVGKNAYPVAKSRGKKEINDHIRKENIYA